MLSEPLVKLNSVYVKVQEALLHLRGDLLVGDTGVVGKAVGGTARIFDAPAFYAQQARQILRKFGSDAHLFVPGVGYMNGFAAGNYLESTGNTNASVDGAVGLVLDAAGSVGAELAVQSVIDVTNRSAWTVLAGCGTPSAKVISLPAVGSELLEAPHGLQTANKTFRISASLSGSGTVSVGISNGIDQAIRQQVTLPATITFHAKFNATNTSNAGFSIQRASGDTATSVTLDSYSYKEVTGTHATQTTTANKPILRQINGKFAWQFDGSNDSLVLPGPLFQMADDHCVVAAIKPLAAGVIAFGQYSSSATGIRLCNIRTENVTGNARVEWYDGVTHNAFTGSNILDSAAVLTGRKVGTSISARQNGTAMTGTASPVSNPVADRAAIGFSDGGGSFNGLIYPIVAIKGTVSDAELRVLEKWLGSIAGVAIA